MCEFNIDYYIKLIIIGDTNVGKSIIINKMNTNKFIHNINPTICIDFIDKYINIENMNSKAKMFHTAGKNVINH